MSLYGALFTGISGLNANSNALSATSNNIANVNTIGYKSEQAAFSTLLTTLSGSNSFAAGGVAATRLQNVDQQGLIQGSTSSTDLAISGNGFFAVTRVPDTVGTDVQQLFTRAGAFRPDGDGYLRNSAGLYLQGWRLDDDGNLPANRVDLGSINLNDLTGTAQPTTSMNLSANLQSSQDSFTGTYVPATPGSNMASFDPSVPTGVEPHFERTIQVYDNQGGAQQLRLAFMKTAANTWQYELIYDGDSADITTAANVPIGSGTITFDTKGTLLTPVSGSTTLTIPFDGTAPGDSGLDPQTIEIVFGEVGQIEGITQFDSPSTIISSGVNGALFGGLTGVQVTEEGYVVAVFDNGVQRSVYKLPLATFANPNGLTATSGNSYLQSEDSGEVTLLEANIGGAGSISSASVEASTVDLAKEFTDLITTQRAYSASTRIITTADEMLSELMQIKR